MLFRSEKVLRRVNRTFHLVFFTTQPDARLPEIKAWLTRHHLPKAPVLTWPGDAVGLAGRIEEAQSDGWTGLKTGVGGSATDAEAFLEQGLAPLILQDEDENNEELPDGATVVKNWREIERHLR